MKNIIEDIAPEILYNILSHLTLPEVYYIRSVSRKFRVVVEYHIYQRIKRLGETINIKLGDNKNKSIELIPIQYDPVNRVIEFEPEHSSSSLSLANTSNQCSVYHRLIKIHFSGWFHQADNYAKKKDYLSYLNSQDQDILLHHEQYNPSIEKVYELPSWNKSSEIKDNPNSRYLGDKGLILSMSYEQSNCHQELLESRLKYIPTNDGLPSFFYDYKSLTSTISIPNAPNINVHKICVTLDWVLSGLIQFHHQVQIYKSSFDKLNRLLNKSGCFKYDPLSEPVLDFVVQDQQREQPSLPHHLISYVQSHTHECHTRLSHLQHLLEGAGVDSRVIWKYTFAKLYVVGNGLLCEEDVVRRIQDSEEEWHGKKKSILRKLNSTTKLPKSYFHPF